ASLLSPAREPRKPALHRTAQTLRIGISDAPQSHQHKCSVVHIRIVVILEFKCPSARRSIWILDLPVSRTENLIRNDPALRRNQRRMSRIKPRFFERYHRDRRVPHRRNARLHAQRVALGNFVTLEESDFA